MATQVGRLNGAGQIAGPVPTRPAKTNFYPMEIYIDGVMTGGSVEVQISPYVETNVWFPTLLFNNVGFQALSHLAERVQFVASGNFAGDVQCLIVPGT